MVIFLYSNKECEFQAINCIQSLCRAITDDTKIVYYTIGFNSTFDFKNLYKYRINFKPYFDLFHFYKTELSLLTMYLFPDEYYFFTDTDVLFSPKFSFDKVINTHQNYPLAGFGPHEYPFLYEIIDGNRTVFDEKETMKYFNVTNRTMRYVWSCFYSFNQNCKDFFEEYTSICKNKYLYDRKKIYFPFRDETAFNVCLWKRNADKNLGFAFLNTHKLSSVKSVEDNIILNRNFGENYDEAGADWEYVDDSNKILFYHGFKDEFEMNETLKYLETR